MSTPSETPAATLITPEVAELIALGAAMAGNCEEAFQTHHHRLHQMGVAKEDMIKAVNLALRVKMAPHNTLVDIAQHYLVGGHGPDEEGCCGGECACETGEGECCGNDEGCGCH